MTHRPVGIATTIAISATSSASPAFSVQSNVLRLVTVGNGAHVAIGTNPTATTNDYYIPVGQSATLSIAPVNSNTIAGITTGTTTIIDFLEGTASPFEPGDCVTLTCSDQPYYNVSHIAVTAVNRNSDNSGYFSERITLGYNSSGIATAYASTVGTLRKSLKVAARTDTATPAVLHLQQVQITSQA